MSVGRDVWREEETNSRDLFSARAKRMKVRAGWVRGSRGTGRVRGRWIAGARTFNATNGGEELGK